MEACLDRHALAAFASRDDLRRTKELGVEDVAFPKKRGPNVNPAVKDSWLYQRPRNFRAGIEAVIFSQTSLRARTEPPGPVMPFWSISPTGASR